MKRLYFTIIILIILGGGVYLIFFRANPTFLSNPPLRQNAPTTSSSALDKEYRNSTYKFSLKMPEDFVAREVASEDIHTILLENKKGEGIQILISPFVDIRALTAEMIHKDLPDLKISDPQGVEIGNGYKGLAFKSDNPAFAGASREIWFVFYSNLYQISTYERFDDLLKGIFTTWKFTPQ